MMRKCSLLVIVLLIVMVAGMVIVILANAPYGTETGPTPADLRPAYRETYVELVARAYQADPTLDLDLVLGPDWEDDRLKNTLLSILDKTDPSQEQAIGRLRNLAAALDVQLTTRERPTSAESDDSNSIGRIIIGVAQVLGIFLLLVMAEFLIKRARRFFTRSPQSSRSPHRVEPTSWQGETEKPLVQFASTYEPTGAKSTAPSQKAGGVPDWLAAVASATFDDDLSFSINTLDDGYLGECGIGVSETVGGGKPKRAAAFEVWMFDKRDIRTVTQVLVSEYAYGDQALQAKLIRKGPLVLARPRQTLKLETANLRARARVVDMAYHQDEQSPARASFEKLGIEIAVWQTEPAAN